MSEYKKQVIAACVACCVFVVVVGIGSPYYQVWYAEMRGKARTVQAEHEGAARLAQAESEKKIQIEGAKAEVESAKLRAEAIEIVGKASKDFPEYRTQEFIGAFAEALKEGNVSQIIYVPTEANIPIMESGRLGAKR
jgi:regulator of protease activity HflC (stomatin/prohibitin superfamily)